MAKNEAKIKFSADTSEFNSQIATAGSALKGLKAELKLNSAQMETTDDTVAVLAKRHELLQKELDASRLKTEALEGKLKSATTIFGENSVEASKLKNDITYAKAAEEKLTAEVGKCASKLEQQKISANETKSALGQLTNTISTQEGELNALKQQYTNVILEQGEGSTEAKQLKDKIQLLSTELGDNKTQLLKVQKATQELGGQMEDTGGKAEKSSDGYTVLKNVVANLATEGIGKAIDGFKNLAVEGESALNKMEAATGASADEINQYDAVMKNLYKSNYTESMGEASDAISVVVQQMGKLKAPEVEKITSKALLLSKTFDMDVNESVRSAKSLMKQFGISSDAAFNLMAQGAQNGLNQNGDLLDVINEYSVQFKNSGYTVTDMFNMLSNGTKAGTWSVDKLGDSVKEFNIRMSDGTANDYLKKLGLNAGDVVKKFSAGGQSAKDATNEVMDALGKVKNENERYTIGVGLMGTTYEDLGEDAVKALRDTTGEIRASKETMDEIDASALADVGSKAESVGKTLKSELMQPIVDKLNPAIKGMTGWMMENMTIVKPIVIGLAVAFTALAVALAITGVIAAVQKAMALLNGTLMMNPIVFIIAAVAGLVAAFIYLWNNCEAFRNFFIGLWEGIKNAVSVAISAIVGFFSGLGENIKGIFSGIAGFITGIWSAQWEIVKQIWSGAGAFFGGIWSGIKGAFGAVANWFGNTFSAAWQAVQNVFSAGGKVFEGIKEGIAGVFFTVVNGIIHGLNAVISAPFKLINGAFDKIRGISIVGAKPFSWLPTLDVPQIPKFAKGGIVNGATLNIAGEAGPEAIVPIEKLQGFIASALTGFFERNLINYEQLYLIFKRAISEQSQSIILDEREIGRVGREIYGW